MTTATATKRKARPLTAKQHKLLAYIYRHWTIYSHAPGYRDMMRVMGLKHVSSIAQHLAALEKRGLVRRPVCAGLPAWSDAPAVPPGSPVSHALLLPGVVWGWRPSLLHGGRCVYAPAADPSTDAGRQLIAALSGVPQS